VSITNLKRFQNALSTAGGECAIISSEINQRYVSGFNFSDGYVIVTPDEGYLFTDSRYIEAARAEVSDLTVILSRGGMLETLTSFISDKKFTQLVIEEDELSCSQLKRFSEIFQGIEINFGASEILRGLRAVKSASEIEKIAAAQKITDAAFTHILNYISPSRTERDVALELEFYMRRLGAEGVAFDTIAVSGSASSLPHGVPTDTPLRQGFLTMDFGAKVDGYCSDMTRTVVIGRADEEMLRVYDTVLNAQLAALDIIKGGILCRDADEAARRVIRDAGYGSNFGHSLGHGVGMFIHESPNLSPKAPETAALIAGNVVTVEPGIYVEEKYGCRIEDMIAINTDGSVFNFTKSTKKLVEI